MKRSEIPHIESGKQPTSKVENNQQVRWRKMKMKQFIPFALILLCIPFVLAEVVQEDLEVTKFEAVQESPADTSDPNIKYIMSAVRVGKVQFLITNSYPNPIIINEVTVKLEGDTVCHKDALKKQIEPADFSTIYNQPLDVPCEIDYDKYVQLVKETGWYDVPFDFEFKVQGGNLTTVLGTFKRSVGFGYCYLDSKDIICGSSSIDKENMFIMNYHPDAFKIRSIRLKSGNTVVCENKDVNKIISGFKDRKDYSGDIKFKCSNLDKVADKIVFYGMTPTLALDIELDVDDLEGDFATITGKMIARVQPASFMNENCYFNEGNTGCKSYKISAKDSYIKLVNFHNDRFKVTGINLEHNGVSCSAEGLDIDVPGRGNNMFTKAWSWIKIKVFKQSTKISFDCQGLELHKGKELTFLMQLDVEDYEGDKGIATGKLKARI